MSFPNISQLRAMWVLNWILSLTITLSFFRFEDPALFLAAFWPHQSSKSDFCYCLPSRWNDLYIDDLDDEYSLYMCSSPPKSSIVLDFSMIWFKLSDFHQVHDFSIHQFNHVHDSLFQVIVFEICYTDEKFSCMSTNACEIDTQVMIVWLIFIKSSIHHLLIFIKFKIFKSDFHQVHYSNCQMIVFETCHTDEKILIYVSRCIRKQHSHAIVDIIERRTVIRLLMSSI